MRPLILPARGVAANLALGSAGIQIVSARRAASLPTFVDYTDANGTGGSAYALNVPAGVQDNDHLIIIQSSNNSTADLTVSGWTSQLQFRLTNPTISILTRVASSEPASYTLTGAGGRVALMLAWRGGANTVDVVGAGVNSVTNTRTASSVTTTVAAVLLGMWARDSATDTITSPPATMTQRGVTTANPNKLYAYSEVLTAAGVTGDRSATWNDSGSTSAVLMAIR